MRHRSDNNRYFTSYLDVGTAVAALMPSMSRMGDMREKGEEPRPRRVSSANRCRSEVRGVTGLPQMPPSAKGREGVEGGGGADA
jgi:hypothetical protein